MQGITLPIVGVAVRAIVLQYCENYTAFLNISMATFGVGSTLAPFAFDALASITTKSQALHYTYYFQAALFSTLSLLTLSSYLCAVSRSHNHNGEVGGDTGEMQSLIADGEDAGTYGAAEDGGGVADSTGEPLSPRGAFLGWLLNITGCSVGAE